MSDEERECAKLVARRARAWVLAAGNDSNLAAQDFVNALFDFARQFGARHTAHIASEVAATVERLERQIRALESRPVSAGIVDCGVFKDGTSYAAGSAVTKSGSLWIAKQQTAAAPGKSPHWRLAVKRGSVSGAGGVKLLDAPRPAAN